MRFDVLVEAGVVVCFGGLLKGGGVFILDGEGRGGRLRQQLRVERMVHARSSGVRSSLY